MQTSLASTTVYMRGVNLSGPESAGDQLPGVEGTHYVFAEEKAYKYFTENGLNLFRIPISWERLQPTLGGELAVGYLDGIKRSAAWAGKYNAKIMIDLHNYGRYNGDVIGANDSSVTLDNFCDLWTRLSDEFKNDDNVYAYDLMNEPHDMPPESRWEDISQAAVNAIRNNNDSKLLIVEGNNWAHSESWPTVNNNNNGPWITDPLDNIMYSAHIYFDYNTSGQYTKTYDEELAANKNFVNIGVERAKPFIDWCKQYNVRGSFGEYGAPHRDDCQNLAGQYDTRWIEVIDRFLDAMDEAGMDGTAWGAGYWWGPNERLNIYPTDQYANAHKEDAVMMSVLKKHVWSPPPPPDVVTIYEGEDAAFGGTAGVAQKNNTASGTKAAGSNNTNGSYVEIQDVRAIEDCFAVLRIRYATGDENACQLLSINESDSVRIDYSCTGDWDNFNQDISLSIRLCEGNNNLKFAYGSGSVDIDYIEITLPEPQEIKVLNPPEVISGDSSISVSSINFFNDSSKENINDSGLIEGDMLVVLVLNNSGTSDESVMAISGLYSKSVGSLLSLDVRSISNAPESAEVILKLSAPEGVANTDDLEIRTMVWNTSANICPITKQHVFDNNIAKQ